MMNSRRITHLNVGLPASNITLKILHRNACKITISLSAYRQYSERAGEIFRHDHDGRSVVKLSAVIRGTEQRH